MGSPVARRRRRVSERQLDRRTSPLDTVSCASRSIRHFTFASEAEAASAGRNTEAAG